MFYLLIWFFVFDDYLFTKYDWSLINRFIAARNFIYQIYA